MKPGDAQALGRYVSQQAPRYHLDAKAVLAVAAVEGLSGSVGDNGTSFGPWQLHKGGAYPASAPQAPSEANAWAWSPAGIDYTLARMSGVAGNQKGAQAVHSLVFGFERPADPRGEFLRAMGVYDGTSKSGGGGFWHDVKGVLLWDPFPGGNPAAAAGAATAEATAGTAESVASFVGTVTSASFWLRALEVVGGGLILVFGVYLLARRVGLAPAASSLTPAGRAAAELAA